MCVRLTRVITRDHRWKVAGGRANAENLPLVLSLSCDTTRDINRTSLSVVAPGLFPQVQTSTATLMLGYVIRLWFTQPIADFKTDHCAQCAPLSAEVQLSCWITIEPFLELISGTVVGARCGERGSECFNLPAINCETPP